MRAEEIYFAGELLFTKHCDVNAIAFVRRGVYVDDTHHDDEYVCFARATLEQNGLCSELLDRRSDLADSSFRLEPVETLDRDGKVASWRIQISAFFHSALLLS